MLSKNPKAIHLLEQNMEKIDWFMLSMNPGAIYLLEQNMKKIVSHRLSLNPEIFKSNKQCIFASLMNYN